MLNLLTRNGSILPALTLAIACLSSGSAIAETRVHSLIDISHQFSFYADGRFFTQYLNDGTNKNKQNWVTLHKAKVDDCNLIVLFGAATPCKYVPQDIAMITNFLKEGGGVILMGDYGTFRKETAYHANDLVKSFGIQFADAKASEPLKAVPELKAEKITYYGGKILKLTDPEPWTILMHDAKKQPVMVRRAVGRGSLLVASRGLFGHRPDAKDRINDQWVKPLLRDLAKGKTVSSFTPSKWATLDNVTTHGKLKLHYTDYLKPEADAILKIYSKCIPEMEKMLGVPPSEGMMGELLLLPSGGGGFSSGNKIGLGVWWGNFPEKHYGMIELIGHEGTHSWVLPFAEPMWNEPIATYVGAHLGKRLGYEKEGENCIQQNIKNAQKLDPDMTKYDIAFGGKEVPRDVEWGKTFWIWEQLRKEKPDILVRYFRAKRNLAKPGKIKKYTPHECIAVISHAMGRDMFPWFQKHGLKVSAKNSAIPLP